MTALEQSVPIGRQKVEAFAQLYKLDSSQTAVLDRYEARWFADMFADAQSQPSQVRELAGPHNQAFLEVMTETHAKLQAIHPKLTGEALIPDTYRPPEVTKQIIFLGGNGALGLDRLRHERRLGLQAVARQALSQHTTIPVGLFTRPEYLPQGDDAATAFSYVSGKACFNACYRMAHSGVTGEKLRESSIALGIYAVQKTALATDSDYLNTFHTQAFRDRYNLPINTLSITGASMGLLCSIAEKLKAKNPIARIVTIVNLQSEVTGKQGTVTDIWHTNILLAAGNKTVEVHDPGRFVSKETVWVEEDGQNIPRSAGDRRHIQLDEFYYRWAIAHNRAHIIISSPAG